MQLSDAVGSIGFIGVGHLARYMIAGLRNLPICPPLHLYSRTRAGVDAFAKDKPGLCVHDSAQAVADAADLIIVATKPDDLPDALSAVALSSRHTVVSVAAGVDLACLERLARPATVVRSLPIACVAINKSPTLLYPANPIANAFFSELGQVHVLPNESRFAPASALVGALYAWMFPFFARLSDWTVRSGFDEATARALLLETIEGACGMARAGEQHSFDEIWRSLATPGGISEMGMELIRRRGGIAAFESALEAVSARLAHARMQDEDAKDRG